MKRSGGKRAALIFLLAAVTCSAQEVGQQIDWSGDPIFQVRRSIPRLTVKGVAPAPAGQGLTPAAIAGRAKDYLAGRMAIAGVLLTVETFSANREFVSDRPAWEKMLLPLGEAVDSSSELLDRIHEVRIRREWNAGARVERAQDGAVILVLAFTRDWQSRSPAYSGDKTLVRRVVHPSSEDIRAAVRRLGQRPEIARFRFDRRFPAFLARYGVHLQVEDTQEVDGSGQYLFHRILQSYGEEVSILSDMDKDPDSAPVGLKPGSFQKEYLRVYLQHMSLFMLRTDASLRYGLDLYPPLPESVLPLSLSSPQERMWVGYWRAPSGVHFPTLSDLDACLGRLWKTHLEAHRRWTCQ